MLTLPEDKKVKDFATPYPFKIRIAYQTSVSISYDGSDVEAIPSTFEGCLVYTNYDLFSEAKCDGLIGDINNLCNQKLVFNDFHEKIYNLFRGNNVSKASFALDLIYSVDPQKLQVPEYINKGLLWLQDLLDKHE